MQFYEPLSINFCSKKINWVIRKTNNTNDELITFVHIHFFLALKWKFRTNFQRVLLSLINITGPNINSLVIQI